MPVESPVAGSLAFTAVTGAAGPGSRRKIGQGADADALSDGIGGPSGPDHDLAEPGIGVMGRMARSPYR